MEEENDNMRTYIVEKVRKFSETEQIEIFKLLQKYKIKFTENSNGIFINLNKLKNEIVEELFKLVKFCEYNKTYFKDESNKLNKFRKKITKKSSISENMELPIDKEPASEYTNVEKGISYKLEYESEDIVLDDNENIIELKDNMNISECVSDEILKKHNVKEVAEENKINSVILNDLKII